MKQGSQASHQLHNSRTLHICRMLQQQLSSFAAQTSDTSQPACTRKHCAHKFMVLHATHTDTVKVVFNTAIATAPCMYTDSCARNCEQLPMTQRIYTVVAQGSSILLDNMHIPASKDVHIQCFVCRQQQHSAPLQNAQLQPCSTVGSPDMQQVQLLYTRAARLPSSTWPCL
jgi:hypothetical protein